MPADRVPAQHAAPRWLRAAMRGLSALSPELAARRGADLFCTARPRRVRTTERVWLDRAERHEVESRGHGLVVRAWGAPPWVLLHHGWSANGAQMTDFVPALLDRGLGVLALDAAGHGDSGGGRNNLVWMTEDALAVTRRFSPWAFVGHSMGAVVGVRVVRAGGALQRLVLIAPPAEFEPYFHAFARAVEMSPRAYTRMLALFGERLGTRFEELTAEWLTRAELPPALIVHDDADVDAPPSHARRWVENWPSAVEEVLSTGLGHRGILHDAEVIEAVAAYLERASKRSSPRVSSA